MADQQPTAADPDRTTRDPEIQKVIDAYLHGKPTNPDGSVKGGGR